jgi:hypothetical protein
MGEATGFHPSRSPASFEVGEARELAVASGDWLLLQANAKAGAQTFTNGERVQVASVGRDGIGLKDGRTLPPSYLTFNYGYAVTSHAAQGKTVDVGLFVASSRSFAAVSRESFYVGISPRKRSRSSPMTPPPSRVGSRMPTPARLRLNSTACAQSWSKMGCFNREKRSGKKRRSNRLTGTNTAKG